MLFYKWIERSDSADPKSKIQNLKFTVEYMQRLTEFDLDNTYKYRHSQICIICRSAV
jgi:hypothetical protein